MLALALATGACSGGDGDADVVAGDGGGMVTSDAELAGGRPARPVPSRLASEIEVTLVGAAALTESASEVAECRARSGAPAGAELVGGWVSPRGLSVTLRGGSRLLACDALPVPGGWEWCPVVAAELAEPAAVVPAGGGLGVCQVGPGASVAFLWAAVPDGVAWIVAADAGAVGPDAGDPAAADTAADAGAGVATAYPTGGLSLVRVDRSVPATADRVTVHLLLAEADGDVIGGDDVTAAVAG